MASDPSSTIEGLPIELLSIVFEVFLGERIAEQEDNYDDGGAIRYAVYYGDDDDESDSEEEDKEQENGKEKPEKPLYPPAMSGMVR